MKEEIIFEDIVEDIRDELPLFAKIHRIAEIKNYVTLNHVGLISICFSLILRVI